MPFCSDIVAIGRVKWIAGSKFTGKDNACWYRFDTRHRSGPVFHWRDQGEVIHPRRVGVCARCGKAYKPRRSTARFCSQACKQQAYRQRLSVTLSVTGLTVTHTVTTAPSHSSEEFRYVLHDDVARFEADGWEVPRRSMARTMVNTRR
jgi:hypothetical protein